MGIHLRKLEKNYIEQQREMEENLLAQHFSWLLNRESPPKNDNEKKQHLLQNRKDIGFAAVLSHITRRRTFSEEASTQTAEVTAIKVALKEIHKKGDKG